MIRDIEHLRGVEAGDGMSVDPLVAPFGATADVPPVRSSALVSIDGAEEATQSFVAKTESLTMADI